jgi:hypothetical protein
VRNFAQQMLNVVKVALMTWVAFPQGGARRRHFQYWCAVFPLPRAHFRSARRHLTNIVANGWSFDTSSCFLFAALNKKNRLRPKPIVRGKRRSFISQRSNLIPFLSRPDAACVSFSKRARARREKFDGVSARFLIPELRNLRLLTPSSMHRNGAAERLCLLEFGDWFRTKGFFQARAGVSEKTNN